MSVSRSLVLVVLLAPLAACDWFSDFKRQPKIDPWEAYTYDSAGPRFRGQPQYSVPTTGSTVPGYAVSYAQLPGVIDSMSGLQNPTPPTEASLENGRKYFTINCEVCHGEKGAGDGPATTYGMVPINLLTPVTQARTDGYIFGMIRNGRGLMPTYNRIEEMDRWDVVNYVRGLQGKLGHPVALGPLGLPGQTGATLPGATRTGPTVPSRFHPMSATPASPGDSATGTTPRDTTAGRDSAAARRTPGATQ
jgi:mono/diheme cytochrome c family protein